MSEQSGDISPRVVDGPSRIDGNGQFAAVPIQAEEIVVVWSGPVVSNAELRRIAAEGKYHSSAAIGEDRNILFEVIDPSAPPAPLASSRDGSGTGGMNHSCDSNLWMQDEVTVVARRDIAADEELTLDYALGSGNAQWSMEDCNCGSPLCRGRVTGNDWRQPELQQRYAGHFSPYLNKRIRKLRKETERGVGMSGVLIRPARIGDGEGLALVWLDTATYYSRLDPERFQIPDADGLADWFEQHWSLPAPDNRFDRVADLDGQVVGLVAACTEEPHDSASRQLVRELAWRRLTVNALGVRTSFWRRGIGRQLFGAAEDWGRGRSATIVTLDTYLHCPVSVPFYEEGMGYTRQSLHFSKHLT